MKNYSKQQIIEALLIFGTAPKYVFNILSKFDSNNNWDNINSILYTSGFSPKHILKISSILNK